jgi:P4 family phage/plasmid primase-like protien
LSYQILSLRSRPNQKPTDETHYHLRWRFTDFAAMLADPIATLDKNNVPEDERHNLFYTVAFCGDEKRKFERQEIIPFDLDGLDTTRLDEYQNLFFETLKIKREKTGVISSGNGLHFLIQIKEPITDKDFFKTFKPQYKALCSLLDRALERAGLPGKFDRVVFEAARILRFPETWNIKQDKITGEIRKKRCVVLCSSLFAQSFDLEELSGLKNLGVKDAIPIADFRRYRQADSAAAFEACGFLKHVKENAAKIDEPTWYAAASVVGRFSDGEQIFQEISKPHPGYSPSATAEKLAQAMEASGPRTCQNISALWDGCNACPHWQKISSPVVIHSKEVISSEATGFYDLIFVGANGAPLPSPKRIPNYGDLVRAFKRDHAYFVEPEGEQIYVFKDTHYSRFTKIEIAAWCERVMEPKPLEKIRGEFLKKALITHLKSKEDMHAFFHEDTRGKINLTNGVLDISTGSLFPHSEDYGFTYVLPYAYDEAATCPTFDKFLNDITVEREALKNTLLDFLAFCFVPTYDDHCFVWLSGSGRNGKSTFMEIARALVGHRNSSSVMLDQFENANYLDIMNSKLLNVSEESDGRKISSKILGVLKALSAGATITVEQKYAHPYDLIPTAKLVFASNVEPNFGAAATAIASRFILIPFEMRLENFMKNGASKVNARILDEIKKELPGILNLALQRLRLQAGRPFKIHRGSESNTAMQALLENSDSVLLWIKDNVEFGVEHKITISDAYENYLTHNREHGEERFPVGKMRFASEIISKVGDDVRRATVGGTGTKGLAGMRLKTQSKTLKTPTAGAHY